MEVDCLDDDVAEDHVEHTIVVGRSYGDVLSNQRLGGLPSSVLEADGGRGIDAAEDGVGPIVEGLDGWCEGPPAGPVAIGRYSQANGVVGPVVIVAMPPSIKGLLGVLEIVEGRRSSSSALRVRLNRSFLPWLCGCKGGLCQGATPCSISQTPNLVSVCSAVLPHGLPLSVRMISGRP